MSGTLTSMGTWYIYGPGVDNPLASWGYTSLGGGYSDTTQHLYFQDWRGSVTDVRDANGANAGWASNQFTAYGAGGGQGDLGVAPGYNGLESNGGLVYMRNRWYDPNAGRFTQEDPIGYAGGINLYGYVGNNPVSFKDPFGLKICPPDCGAIHAVSGVAFGVVGALVGATVGSTVPGGGTVLGGAGGAVAGSAVGVGVANVVTTGVEEMSKIGRAIGTAVVTIATSLFGTHKQMPEGDPTQTGAGGGAIPVHAPAPVPPGIDTSEVKKPDPEKEKQ